MTDYGGIALVITASGSLVASLAAAITSMRNGRSIRDVRAAVDTGNKTLIGALVQEQFGTASMDVDPAVRTVDEQDAVEMLSDQARATHAENNPDKAE